VSGNSPLRIRLVENIDGLTPDDINVLKRGNIPVNNALDGFVSGNELVINRSNIKTLPQASLLAAHEVLGHVGMRALHGPSLDASLDRYYQQLGGLNGVVQQAARFGVSLPDQYGPLVQSARVTGNKTAQRALVQELFAAGAEQQFAEPGNPVANAISDFVSRTKGFFAKFPVIGRVFDTMSERDVMRVVRQASRAAKRLNDAPTDIPTAASIGIAERVVGRAKGDRAVRIPNEIINVGNVVEEATTKSKQKATNEARSLFGTSVDQLSLSANSLTKPRKPIDGTLRKKAQDSTKLNSAIENLADSQNSLRKNQKAAEAYYNEGDQRVTELGKRVVDTLEDKLVDVEASPQSDLLKGESQFDQNLALIEDVKADLSPTLESNNPQDIRDAMATHDHTVRYRGLSVEQFRETIVHLDALVDDAVRSLGAVLGLKKNSDALATASSVAEALTTIEKNNAAFLINSEVNSIGRIERDRVLNRIKGINASGRVMTPELGQKLREELEAIGRNRYSGPKDYDTAREEVNKTGLTTAAARQILDKAGVTADNLGDYAGVIDALQQVQRTTLQMRAPELPQAYYNERVLHGFKHDYPVESVDVEGEVPLYANSYTHRAHQDFTSEVEQKSQLTGNVVYDVRIQAQLASQNMHFNSEVVRSLAINVLASQVDENHREQTNFFYDVKDVKIISKDSETFRKYSANLLEGKEARNTFIYAVPDSNAAVLMQFDNLSNTPLQIRGERKGEKLRETDVFKASRAVTGNVSKFMTRYNLNFLPRSHFREFLIGGLIIGSEQGLGAMSSFLQRSLDNNTAAPDIYKYMRLRNLRTPEAERERQQLLKTSPTARQLQDLINESGLVTQLSALSEPGQADITRRNTGSNLSKAGVQVDAALGSLSDATDAIVRLSAYQSQLSQGKSKQQAAVYAKRLANFEARGRYSGPLGDALLFYNPTAISGARVIESVLEGEYGRPAMVASLGAGMATGFALAAFSGTDEEGRNLYDREGLDRQTTDLRIPLGNGTTVTLPAGFSGASAGFLFGLQMAGFLRGKQDMSQLAANTFEVLTSNFSPIPGSSIPLVDSQGQPRPIRYLADTFTPSALKPVMQFLANLNGLGLPIYRTGFGNTAGGLTDAFNGRESDVGTWSERLAIAMHEATNGSIDVNPNTLRHFMSSYFNGINTILDFGAEAYNVMEGGEAGASFIDRSLGFGGFFSKAGHNDEYYQTRRQIDAISKQVKTHEANGNTRLAQQVRDRLPANFDELVKQINRNKNAQDKINSQMRPLIYASGLDTVSRRRAIDLQNERRRKLQVEGLAIMRQIVPE